MCTASVLTDSYTPYQRREIKGNYGIQITEKNTDVYVFRGAQDANAVS